MGAEHPSSPGTPTGQSVLDFGEFGGSEASDSLPLPPPAAAALGGHAPEGGSLAPATPGGRPLSAGLSSRSSSSPFAAAADALPQVEEEAEATEEAFLGEWNAQLDPFALNRPPACGVQRWGQA